MDQVPRFKPIMHENFYGTIGGTGLKVFPDGLTNLYFHVLGENTFNKVAASTGYPLPDRRFDYSTDDGLSGL